MIVQEMLANKQQFWSQQDATQLKWEEDCSEQSYPWAMKEDREQGSNSISTR